MNQCCLCSAESEIEGKADGFLVYCPGMCGPYVITQKALNDFDKIAGRKQGAIDRVQILRRQDRTRLIRISHDSVVFIS